MGEIEGPQDPRGQEVELKVGLATEADRQRLLKRLGPAVRTVLQRNIFLDGCHGELRQRRAALRLRRERVFPPAGPPEDSVLLTFKHGEEVEGSLFRRSEVECPVGMSIESLELRPETLLTMGVAPVAAVKRLAPGLDSLVSLGAFENVRAELEVELDVGGRRICTLWEIDRSTFPGGRVECELELELAQAEQASAVLDAVRKRLENCGVTTRPAPVSKFERFIRASQQQEGSG